MHVDRRMTSRLSRCHPYKPPQKSPCYFRQSFLHQGGNLKVEPSRSQYLDKDESRNRAREPDHERGRRPPSAARSPLRETTGRDGPYSSFRPIDGGAAAQGQMRGRPIKQKGRRDRAYRQKNGPTGPVLWGCAISARPRRPSTGPRRDGGRSARGPPDKTKKACAGISPRGPARTRAKRKRPLLAGGVLLSHGLHRSTIGARGLNFRVRDGTGCASPAMAAGQQGAFSSAGRARPCPQGRTALESSSRAGTATACPPRVGGRGNRVRARTISTARLSGSPHLRLRPIQQVVCLCPYQKEDSSREGLPA